MPSIFKWINNEDLDKLSDQKLECCGRSLKEQLDLQLDLLESRRSQLFSLKRGKMIVQRKKHQKQDAHNVLSIRAFLNRLKVRAN